MAKVKAKVIFEENRRRIVVVRDGETTFHFETIQGHDNMGVAKWVILEHWNELKCLFRDYCASKEKTDD